MAGCIADIHERRKSYSDSRTCPRSHSCGALQGKRAVLSVTVGGPAEDYAPRGINGPLEQLLFPITHGTLFFPGMDVLCSPLMQSTEVAS
jgi:putative NADPH-quinone reductase